MTTFCCCRKGWGRGLLGRDTDLFSIRSVSGKRKFSAPGKEAVCVPLARLRVPSVVNLARIGLCYFHAVVRRF